MLITQPSAATQLVGVICEDVKLLFWAEWARLAGVVLVSLTSGATSMI